MEEFVRIVAGVMVANMLSAGIISWLINSRRIMLHIHEQ